jgi:hypothetical protein
MDFLKKHYDKIALAVVLVALIASAIFLALRINALSSEPPPNPVVGKAARATHAVFGSYSNALDALAHPPLWTNTAGLDAIPPNGQSYKQDDNTKSNEFPVVLMGVVRKPFKLLFKIYSYDSSTNEGYNFQINFQFRARTFFIRGIGDLIKDRYEDTGYKITKFEKKSATVNDPTLGGQHEKDVSELTVQHGGEKPVLLVLGQESEDQEPVAQIRCGSAGATREYRRGQSFECERKTYRVFDIDMDQKLMVIIDTQTQEQHPIKSQQ